VASAVDPNPQSGSRAGSSEERLSILLVDDEETVRRVTSRLLAKLGYSVTPAASAEDALQILSHGVASFDLVLTDVVMPGKSGIEMVQELRETLPEQRVLFMSGYTTREFGRPPGNPPRPFMPKPFSMQELREAVEGALERPARDVDASG
jgi:two-component system cell cycle sensor histidine kinase/response regulator CckA